jgi:hypothetical protein
MSHRTVRAIRNCNSGESSSIIIIIT